MRKEKLQELFNKASNMFLDNQKNWSEAVAKSDWNKCELFDNNAQQLLTMLHEINLLLKDEK